jgi:hypothetical protein
MAWYTLPVDPKAGNWKHEIFTRLAVTTATLCALAVPFPYLTEHINIKTQGMLWVLAFYLALTLPLASAEAFLRRSWKLIPLLLTLGFAVYLPFVLRSQGTEDRLSESYFLLPFGALVGLVSGLAARSLLATILAFHAAALATIPGVLLILDESSWSPENPILFFIYFFGIVVLPIALATGLSITLGVALAKHWGRARNLAAPRV